MTVKLMKQSKNAKLAVSNNVVNNWRCVSNAIRLYLAIINARDARMGINQNFHSLMTKCAINKDDRTNIVS